MARPQHQRKMASPPLMMGYQPFGIFPKKSGKIVLHFDEYEAIRLLDYEGFQQKEAAKRMQISRPTLTRIYENARKTIAKAMVEGKTIAIEGGNVEFDQQWFRCKHCFKLVNNKETHVHINEEEKENLLPLLPLLTNK